MGDMLLLFIVVPIIFAFGIGVIAWPVMLFIGNASIASAGLVPALGYETTFWLTGAVALATGSSALKP